MPRKKAKLTELPTEKFYWSASKKGFYNSRIHNSLPDDAQEISRAKYEDILSKQAQAGYGEIYTKQNGDPAIRKRQKDTVAQARKKALQQLKNLYRKKQPNPVKQQTWEEFQAAEKAHFEKFQAARQLITESDDPGSLKVEAMV